MMWIAELKHTFENGVPNFTIPGNYKEKNIINFYFFKLLFHKRQDFD